MRALVTGCAGFIGSNLVDRMLDMGYEVVGVDCFTDYYPRKIKEANIASALHNPKFTLIEKNILDINKGDMPQVEYVFHQAAQAGVRASWGKSFEIYSRNNIEATQRLLEHYKEAKIKKFVYTSSSSVYGRAELPMVEDSLLRPESPYGVTKLAGENLCHLYHQNYAVPTITLRYFTVYGPRQRPDMAINKFVRAILNSEEITIFGDGNQTRDFTYVDDVTEATLLAARSSLTGEAINIGGGARVSVKALINKLEEFTSRKAVARYIETQKGDVRDTLAYIEKARDLLNWKPKVKIDKGLQRYIEWSKSRAREA